jgi:hypothetical protein
LIVQYEEHLISNVKLYSISSPTTCIYFIIFRPPTTVLYYKNKGKVKLSIFIFQMRFDNKKRIRSLKYWVRILHIEKISLSTTRNGGVLPVITVGHAPSGGFTLRYVSLVPRAFQIIDPDPLLAFTILSFPKRPV